MAKKAQYRFDKEDPYPNLPPRGLSTPHQREFDKQWDYERADREISEFSKRLKKPFSSTIEQDQKAQRGLAQRGIGPPEKKRDDYLERKGIGPSREFFVRPGKRAYENLKRESDLERIKDRQGFYKDYEEEMKKPRTPRTPEPRFRPEDYTRRRM